tara:strand:+ start:1265 stop:1849 length:585 start_codon:yes stop_codon:yes gene_type:complete
MNTALTTRRHKVCAKCGQEKSRNSFGKGPNKTWCNRCNKEISKVRRSDAKKKRLKSALSEFTAMLRGTQVEAPHVAEYCAKLIEKFGSLDKIVEMHHSVLTALVRDNPGSKTAIDAMNGLVRLMELSTKYRDSAPDIEDLDDSEIEEELSRLMLARLTGEPELLNQLVDASGLRVIDSGEQDIEYTEIVNGNNG